MIKTSFGTLFISILMLSCGSTSTQTTTTNPHANMHQELINVEKQKLMKENFIKEISGSYLGEIPCADCEKIIYRLQLNKNSVYRYKLTYEGKSNTPIEYTGTYTITDNYLIQLDQQAGSMNYFKKVNNGLLLLDKNGNEITGSLSDKYIFQPISEF